MGDPGSVPGSGRSSGEGIDYPLQYSWASLVAQLVNNPPAMWETWVQSLSWEDPLEEGNKYIKLTGHICKSGCYMTDRGLIVLSVGYSSSLISENRWGKVEEAGVKS